MQQERNITDKSCLIRKALKGISDWLPSSSHSHLHNPFAVNFTEDVLIALQLTPLFSADSFSKHSQINLLNALLSLGHSPA